MRIAELYQASPKLFLPTSSAPIQRPTWELNNYRNSPPFLLRSACPRNNRDRLPCGHIVADIYLRRVRSLRLLSYRAPPFVPRAEPFDSQPRLTSVDIAKGEPNLPIVYAHASAPFSRREGGPCMRRILAETRDQLGAKATSERLRQHESRFDR